MANFYQELFLTIQKLEIFAEIKFREFMELTVFQ